MATMQQNARLLSERIVATGNFELVGEHHNEQLPLVAFRLAGERDYDEFDVAAQLAAERGWMVPAYTLPPDADQMTIMRALCKETLGQSLTRRSRPTSQMRPTLDQKGGLHALDRKRVKTGTGY